jgi:hypothetical protein
MQKKEFRRNAEERDAKAQEGMLREMRRRQIQKMRRNGSTGKV